MLTESWTLILSWADQQPIDAFRRVYERFLIVFPTSGRHWRVYIEQGIHAGAYPHVDIIDGLMVGYVLYRNESDQF